MASNSLQVVESQNQLAKPQSFAPQTFTEALEFANYLSKSTLIPQEFRSKPENILVAIQHGAELGLPPMQSLNCICVINGKPAIYGPSALAVVKSHRDFEYIRESFDDATMTATCEVKRRGEPAVIRTFSKEDAKQAGLWDERKTIPNRDGNGSRPNPAPWFCYPKRMLMFRARGFALNDCLPDALRGIITAEEAADYPQIEAQAAVVESKPTGKIDVKAEPPAQAQTEEVIGKEAAVEFYKVYKAHGWSPDEAKTFLKGTFGIEPPKTSADIPKSRLKEAMDWASMNAPIRDEADGLFDQLGWTTDEKQAFVNEQKWNWPSIVAALKAEIQKRNQHEQ